MQATIRNIIPLSATVTSFVFEPERPLDYIAGQFADITLPHKADELGITRQFTLSSSPTEPHGAFTVRFPDTSSSFKHALKQLKPGDLFHISGSLGDFVLPRISSTPLVWIAGGIGITPFRSHAVWLAAADEHRDITLHHRTSDDTRLWRNEFNKINLTPHDYTSAKDLQSRLHANPEALYYIAGSPDFTRTIQESLIKKDVGPDKIVTDAFLGY